MKWKELILNKAEELLIRWKQLDKEKFKLSPKRFTFLFFLLLSTILWFLNALSREYSDKLDYPIRYVNFPPDFVLLNKPPNELSLDVKAYGYSLFYHKITPDVLPLHVDFSKTPLRQLTFGDTMSYFIESGYLQNEIASQISSEIKLNDIKPDSIIFTFTKTISKKVPVSWVAKLEFQQPFRQKGNVQLNPDSVIIKGPQAIVNTLDSITTSPLLEQSINENKQFELNLVQHNFITLSHNSVIADIEVEKYTEHSVTVPLNIQNLPDSLHLISFPNKVRVNFLVNLENFKKISKYDFKAALDFEHTKRSLTNKIPVLLLSSPNEVQILNISPKQVEFIVERK